LPIIKDAAKVAIYMTDVNLARHLPGQHGLPEILPGGAWCMMNKVPIIVIGPFLILWDFPPLHCL
jgi:hypothetical protein